MRKSMKITAVLGGGAVVLATAGVAYAYWTTSGTGSGSASTTTNAVVLSFSQTAAEQALDLYPGQAAQPITGTVKNTQAAGGQNGYVGTVTATIASVTAPNSSVALPCDATDYTLGGSPTPVNTDLAPQGTAAFGGQTIQFNNKATNQDGCQGATVNLTFTSN
ncbi:MAG TPA: hypothetical protein VMZ11_07100 [Mycobacteriales bacterium]|nr:hypothetical protein [Mycobacteriales bacterium]